MRATIDRSARFGISIAKPRTRTLCKNRKRYGTLTIVTVSGEVRCEIARQRFESEKRLVRAERIGHPLLFAYSIFPCNEGNNVAARRIGA